MHRPVRVTFIALVVLSLAATNLVRFSHALNQADLMKSLSLEGALNAQMLTGITWTVGLGAAAYGLFRLRLWAWKWTLVAIVLYHSNLWLIRLVFERSPEEPLTRLPDLIFSALGILFIWALLFWPRVYRTFHNTQTRVPNDFSQETSQTKWSEE